MMIIIIIIAFSKLKRKNQYGGIKRQDAPQFKEKTRKNYYSNRTRENIENWRNIKKETSKLIFNHKREFGKPYDF